MKKEDIKMLDITWRALFKVAVAIVLFYIVYLLRNIIVWIVLSLIVSILLNPIIEILERKKINRVGATIIVYVSLLLVGALALYIIIPPMLAEIQVFNISFAQYFDKIPGYLNELGLNSLKDIASLSPSLNENLLKFSTNIFNIFASLAGSIFASVTVFVLALFMSIEEKEIVKGLKLISPKQFEEEVIKRWDRSQDHVILWFGSRVLASICVAVMTFLLCVFLKIKFALSLALLAGILNIVPMVGPIISAAVIALFALAISFPKFIIVIIFLIIIQQIENNILTPIFTKKLTGLPNVLIFLSILIGGALGGIVGAILAIPFAGILFEVLRDYFNKRKLD